MHFLVIILLLIVQCTVQGHSRNITYAIPDNDLRAHCSFNFNKYEYDLCRLVGLARVVDTSEIVFKADGTIGEESNSGHGDYLLTLGGIEDEDNSHATNVTPCDSETWVCISYKARSAENIGSNGVESTTLPIVRKESDSRMLFMLDYEGESERLPRLQLMLSNARHSPSAVIEFSCGQVDKLDLISVDGGRHFFVWSTPHGCPINPASRRSRPSIGILQDSGKDGGQDPNDGDGKPNDELLPSDSRRARGWIAVVIVVSVLSLICGSILASSPRARHFVLEHVRATIYTLLSFLAEVVIKLKPIGQSITSLMSKTIFRFRQGDHDLARWAEEDMALDSEDLMLNRSMDVHDRYHLEEVGWDVDGLNEYIPLTTSPKYGRGRRLQSYGTTPEVETFDQVDVMTGIGRYFKKTSKNTRAN